MRSRHAKMSKSFWPSLLFPSNRSKQLTSLSATFHSNPSCNLKNSRNAGSSLSSPSCFLIGGSLPGSTIMDLGLFEGAIGFDGEVDERQIWARSPSTCRNPLRILPPSYEDKLSKERESRASIVCSVGLSVGYL